MTRTPLLTLPGPLLLLACQAAPAEPEPPRKAPTGAAMSAARPVGPVATAARPRAVSADDPEKGEFTLAEAVAGLPATGKLIATISTDKGELACELFDDRAPIAVANFVGLARGLRPFKTPGGTWEKKPAYDGTTFHRVVKGFMIQGGDPAGTGAGEPGYVFPDEVWPGAKHDKRGQLCMANRGANTNGMQFFITDGAAPHLDKGYTIFGQCEAGATLDALASVPVRGERAVDPPRIRSITIKR